MRLIIRGEHIKSSSYGHGLMVFIILQHPETHNFNLPSKKKFTLKGCVNKQKAEMLMDDSPEELTLFGARTKQWEYEDLFLSVLNQKSILRQVGVAFMLLRRSLSCKSHFNEMTLSWRIVTQKWAADPFSVGYESF